MTANLPAYAHEGAIPAPVILERTHGTKPRWRVPRTEDLPIVETHRGEHIRRSATRYHAAGWTALTIEGARERIDHELALRVALSEHAEWKAAKDAKAIPDTLTFREWKEKRKEKTR